MDLRQVTPAFAVAPQIDPGDASAIRAAGYRTVICNRPDGEVPGQPSTAEVRAAVETAGMTYMDLPVVSGAMTDADVTAFGAALQTAEAPVLAFCRSGTRSIVLWAFSARANGTPIADLEAATRAAGYDIPLG